MACCWAIITLEFRHLGTTMYHSFGLCNRSFAAGIWCWASVLLAPSPTQIAAKTGAVAVGLMLLASAALAPYLWAKHHSRSAQSHALEEAAARDFPPVAGKMIPSPLASVALAQYEQ